MSPYNSGRCTCSNSSRWTSTTTVSGWGNCSCSIVYSISEKNSEEYKKKIKELLRKERIKNMKLNWNELKKEFKPAPILRPEIQLRGVCFSGRGWA